MTGLLAKLAGKEGLNAAPAQPYLSMTVLRQGSEFRSSSVNLRKSAAI
jgi:hypothetical protein